jgi:putative hydrolase of the HAD superfamily
MSPQIRAVFFDAVGTVLFPVPGAPQIYAETAAAFGLSADPVDVLTRFKAAFRREEEVDRAAGWVTSELREEERWRAIVTESLPGAPAGVFERLYGHFAKPEAWQVPDGFSTVSEELAERGLVLGLASNYDSRLESVLAGRPELARLRERVVVSSGVGVRKPGAGFFAEVLARSGCLPHEILFVGDDIENDYEGATAAGFQAVLLDPAGKCPQVPRRIASLADLLREPRVSLRFVATH